MVFRKVFKKFAKKRKGFVGRKKFMKKKRLNGPHQIIVRQPRAIPDVLYTKLMLTFSTVYSSTGSSLKSVAIKGNDIFAPLSALSTPSSTQPVFYDQMALIYGKYIVSGSKCHIMVNNINANSADTAATTIALTPYGGPNDLAALTPETLSAQRYGKIKKMGTAISGTNQNQISSYMSTKQIYGYEHINQTEELMALTGASPTRLWYWYFALAPIVGITIYNFEITIRMTYYVKLFFPKSQLDA